MKRVAVIRKSDSVQIGTMPASVGMVLWQDTDRPTTIARVNLKTVTLASGFRSEGIVCIPLSEARRFGWPKAPGCNVFKERP